MVTPDVSPSHSPIRRLQVLAITVVGAIAILLFLLSLLVDGGAGQTLERVAGGFGIACAVIGVSFALVGNSR